MLRLEPIWVIPIGISTPLPSGLTTVPAAVPSGRFAIFTTSRIVAPSTSSVPFQVPSNALAIGALLGAGISLASPVRDRFIGMVKPLCVTVPDIDRPSAESAPTKAAGSGPPLTMKRTADTSTVTDESGSPFTPCAG
jgi:hypothetical protein